ncbi:GNAT family N-acetyltransferase [Microbacterium sp. KUDC0406]|uniref:GNAT family N-acetyltransferase n=1 Tax=Microbacterium sp. KUDC0406 TaxID=2909588 RepID=UPI001F35525E|nr:GNAT family protein [Microbacterium sp. KUDC0406]UJP11056.1 GNAT family N-acetyltransferase [Microbacterium sp. KUDC0406]
MDLRDAFPPFGLRIEAGPLVLRPITDDVLPTLIDVAAAGVHDPNRMPFSYPWTDASPDRLPTNFVQYHWGTRTRWSTNAWALDLAVEYEGEIVGTQGFTTHDYLVTRTGETGSWLGLAHHDRGIGTRMRQAICAFVFDHLDAEEITSAAFADNPASLAVSRKVGYRPDGRQRLNRRGESAVNQRLVLAPEDLVRGEPIVVTGVEAFRSFIGLDRQES